MAENWAQAAIDALARGETCVLVPYGNSMRPLIFSGATVTLQPLSVDRPLCVGEAVLVDVGDRTTLHRVLSLCEDAEVRRDLVLPDEAVLIGDNRGHVDGWVSLSAVHGRVVAISNPEQTAKLNQTAKLRAGPL